MTQWVRKGLSTGVKTTSYPARHEPAAGVSPGLPVVLGDSDRAAACLTRDTADPVAGPSGAPAPSCTPSRNGAVCPTGAIAPALTEKQSDAPSDVARVDYARCVHCFRCQHASSPALEWQDGYEWASQLQHSDGACDEFQGALARSLHIRVVDAGDCGACLSELKQLGKPHYNMHRLGFFITPTPRQADVLIVTGPVTDNMRGALLKTYEAMPVPKAVIAVGACALTGGVFGHTFASQGGVSSLLPVQVAVPGCPPPPLAILHALLVLTGRKPSSELIDSRTLPRRITE